MWDLQGFRVSEGTRTPDRLDHNQELYQLSYAHRGRRAWRRGVILRAGAWAARAKAEHPREDSNLRPAA